VIASIVDRILSLHGFTALLVVFLLPALEASAFVGFVFPGEVAALLAGVLAFQGRISLWAAIVAVVLGAVAGDSVGYAIGRRWGRRILTGVIGRVPFLGHRVEEHLDSAEAFLRRRRGSAVFFGRFTAALRVMVPGLAGMSRIPFPVFAAYNVAGGVLWGAGFVLLGFSAGAAWRSVEGVATRVGLALLVAIVGGLIAVRLVRRWRRAEAAERGPLSRLRRRFPRTGDWVAARIDPTTATGFPLTLTVLLAGASAWTFVGLTQDVLTNEESVRWDPTVASWFVHHRVGWATAGMKVVTFLGSNVVLIPLGVLVAVSLWVVWRNWRPGVLLLSSMGGAILLYQGFKAFVDRPRPRASIHLVSAGGSAFPSGHATQVVASFATLALLLSVGRPWRMLAPTWTLAVIVVLAVGASRLYLGVHWLTDVLGGYTLGGAWVGILWSTVLGLHVPLGPRRRPP
jgi:undecaprenyl-diphosphatase